MKAFLGKPRSWASLSLSDKPWPLGQASASFFDKESHLTKAEERSSSSSSSSSSSVPHSGHCSLQLALEQHKPLGPPHSDFSNRFREVHGEKDNILGFTEHASVPQVLLIISWRRRAIATLRNFQCIHPPLRSCPGRQPEELSASKFCEKRRVALSW